MRSLIPCVLVAILAFAYVADSQIIFPSPLPPGVRVSKKRGIAVSGISAGAFFAVQYQVAYSSYLTGAGIIAGGPFYCAQDSLTNALVACVSVPSEINVEELVGIAQDCAAAGQCDSVANLTNHNVWLFSGLLDSVVNQGVVKTLEQFYDAFKLNVSTVYDVLAEHAWITNDFGNGCSTLGSPYISNCDIDAASVISNTVYGNLNAPVAQNTSAYFYLDQSKYTPLGIAPADISMGPNALLYVPHSCLTPLIPCRLMIAFAGCEMTLNDIGYDFVQYSGLNEIAEANSIVVLYPQIVRSDLIPENPNGCFDWWGYTNSNYANNQGAQMQTVFNMMQALRSGVYSAVEGVEGASFVQAFHPTMVANDV